MRLVAALLLCLTLITSGTAMAKGWLETPFTAEQIHASCADGTKMSALLVDATGKRTIRDWVFHGGTDKDVVVQSTTRDDAGNEVEPTADVKHTWVELQRHARYRNDDAQRARSEFETRLGHFEGWVYDVNEVGPDGTPTHTRLWFADLLPGPPLRMEIRVGDVTVMTMEVMSRSPMPELPPVEPPAPPAEVPAEAPAAPVAP
jgi:hypothetical protein